MLKDPVMHLAKVNKEGKFKFNIAEVWDILSLTFASRRGIHHVCKKIESHLGPSAPHLVKLKYLQAILFYFICSAQELRPLTF
jgi:hypothetical protein